MFPGPSNILSTLSPSRLNADVQPQAEIHFYYILFSSVSIFDGLPTDAYSNRTISRL